MRESPAARLADKPAVQIETSLPGSKLASCYEDTATNEGERHIFCKEFLLKLLLQRSVLPNFVQYCWFLSKLPPGHACFLK